MVVKKIDGKDVQFSTNLRVAHILSEMHDGKELQDIFANLKGQDIDACYEIIYAGYAANKNNEKKTFEEVRDMIMDSELGLLAVTALATEIFEGVTYAGLSEAEIAEKKEQAIQATIPRIK